MCAHLILQSSASLCLEDSLYRLQLHTHTHVHTHKDTHTHTHTHTNTHTHTHTHAGVQTHAHKPTHTSICTSTHAHAHTHKHIHTHTGPGCWWSHVAYCSWLWTLRKVGALRLHMHFLVGLVGPFPNAHKHFLADEFLEACVQIIC